MEYTIDLLSKIRHRYISLSNIYNYDFSKNEDEVMTLLDTGAFNSMIDIGIAQLVGTKLPIGMPVSIGGKLGMSQGYILHRVEIGNFSMDRVFVLAFPFDDWLVRHFILGANILNNWEFTTSRADDIIRLSEKIPIYTPNNEYPYQNYFKNGEYVAVQAEI